MPSTTWLSDSKDSSVFWLRLSIVIFVFSTLVLLSC